MTPRPIEISLRKFIDALGENSKSKPLSFLLAVSGGLDSMAMLYAFLEMRKRLPLKLCVAHIHHGGGDPETVSFRNQSHDVVRDVCLSHGVVFFTNILSTDDLSQVPDYGKSEASFRRLRREALVHIQKTARARYVVLAHHRDDLLETRLMRLMRGCGPLGFVAMTKKRGAVLRPFLHFSRLEIEDYIHGINGHWVEDPSNSRPDFLRNWIRHSWLPALEAHQPGSKAVMANSLHLLAQGLVGQNDLKQCFSADGKIIRSELLSLSLEDRKRVFALYLRQQNVKDYGLSHVNELVKRLDVERKELRFKLAQKNWLANARHIWCEG